MELSHISGHDEIPVRIELAELLTAMPARRPAALLHLRRILQIDPDQSEIGPGLENRSDRVNGLLESFLEGCHEAQEPVR